MSPDEIFAAHMWPWPDPLLKRDPSGRVIFVNAAFLQIYGGRVEDWRGNVVAGWPAPQNTGAPFRFETQLAGYDGPKTYDWIEYTVADQNALAIARDVTDLLTSPDTPPGDSAPAPTDAAQTDSTPAHTPTQEPAPALDNSVAAHAALMQNHAAMMDAPAQTGSQEPLPGTVQNAPMHDTPLHEVPMHEAPIHDTAPYGEAAETPHVQDPVAGHSDTPAYDAPTYDTTQYNHTQTADHAPVPATETPAPEVPEHSATADTAAQDQSDARPERDHERRALPIENGDSVLGNNWRDAVIAKAVGADMPSAEDAQAPAQEGRTQEAPTPATQAPAPAADNGAPKQASDLRILLAEDNAINALLTRTLLEAEGCSVDVVEDGALAVEAVKNARYDMIFMDMRMPNMDGLESTRKIRALGNVPNDMPIVALTANAFDDDRNACFDSGMNDFMTKPVSAEELSEMVHNWAINPPEQRKAS